MCFCLTLRDLRLDSSVTMFIMWLQFIKGPSQCVTCHWWHLTVLLTPLTGVLWEVLLHWQQDLCKSFAFVCILKLTACYKDLFAMWSLCQKTHDSYTLHILTVGSNGKWVFMACCWFYDTDECMTVLQCHPDLFEAKNNHLQWLT
jgi:hypothetical protein